MDAEEQAVIDSFQGKKAYERVMENAAFYLAEPGQTMTMIGMNAAEPETEIVHAEPEQINLFAEELT
jgi:hypothetical protein